MAPFTAADVTSRDSMLSTRVATALLGSCTPNAMGAFFRSRFAFRPPPPTPDSLVNKAALAGL
eukprot:1299137-Prymnesium_polylepis.1